MTRILTLLTMLLLTLMTYCSLCLAQHEPTLITAALQQKMTPDDVLQRLIRGNKRFVTQHQINVDLLKKARLTTTGQHPVAIILSCIDSRVPPEIVFDQNIGNVFVTRVAANVIDHDVLAGLEYATKVTGAKLIVVLGHDSCGAIKGACDNVKLGNLTQLLNKIQPAIQQAKSITGKQDCNDTTFINLAAKENVINVVKLIPQKSPVIRQLVQEGRIKIVGAMYHLNTGKITFLK